MTVYWVCVDCYLAANGYDQEIGHTPDRPPLGLIDGRVLVGLPATDHAPDCPVWCGDPNRADVPVAGAECECEHDTFSSRPCEGCGSRYAGTREAVTTFDD